MRLIESVQITNFRSIRSATIGPLNAYVPVVGLNGSGKSNFLRALNLFFDGSEIEPGVSFSLKRDHHDPGRRFGGRRRVAIRVTFDLAAGYEPRKEVSELFDRLGVSESFVVERAYMYAGPEEREELLAAPDGEGQF